MLSKPIIIIDFCGTCVDFQTADAFVAFVRNIEKSSRMERIEKIRLFAKRAKILRILDCFGIHINKKIIAFELKGISIEKIDAYAKQYYFEVVKPHFIPKTLKLINDYKKVGCEPVFVSAAYFQYLKYAASDLGVSFIVCTKLLSKHGVMTGKISKDCIGKEKVKMFFDVSKQANFSFASIEASIGDSKSDIPILSLGKEMIVLSLKHQAWVDKGKFKEIIYG